MTTFQRFKRDVRSRTGSSQGRSTVFKSLQKKDPNIYNFVNFSSPTIIFSIDQKNPYSVFILKISNLTGYRIHFKIRCNNSKCYTVTPYEQVISDKQTKQIKFQFHSNDLNSNFSDKFQIMWGKIPYKPTQPSSLTQSKIFPVQIRQRDQNQNYITQYQQLKLKYGNKDFQQTNSVSSPQKFVNNSQRMNTSSTLLTKSNLIIVSAVSFILGFIFT